VGRAIASHVAAARGQGPAGLQRALEEHVAWGGADGICVLGAATPVCAGPPELTAAMRAPATPPPAAGSVEGVRGTAGRSFMVALRAGSEGVDATASPVNVIVARVTVAGDSGAGSPLVPLVALYMVVFALALLVFAYFALTRLIVRPVEQLVGAADRVASGARTLRVPRYGARELVELGASVQTMAEKLIAEEATLIIKVEELTEATRHLTDTRAQLVRSERMASVGRLAAGLAHEIGNPIAALMGMEDLLLEGGLDAGDERDFLQRMRRETERIHVVVRDLLDFARPEGHSEAETGLVGSGPWPSGVPASADVASVVADVVSLVKPQKPLKAVRMETDVAAGLAVALPAPRLTQVLLNLVLNAGAAAATGPRLR
jgi:signal transduction histidine kinase